MKHRVDRHGLQPCVPGAAGLGRPGVHLGRGEADVTPEGQDEDADGVMVLIRHDAGSLVHNDVEDRAYQSQGLLKGDDTG